MLIAARRLELWLPTLPPFSPPSPRHCNSKHSPFVVRGMSSQKHNNGTPPQGEKLESPSHMDPGVEAVVQAIHASPMRAMLLFSGGASQVGSLKV